MLGQVDSQTSLTSAAWNDQRLKLPVAGVPERFEQEREKDRRGGGRGRRYLFCLLQLGLQSLVFFGELSVLRFQFGDSPRLRFPATPLRLAFARRLRKARAQSRSLNYKPRPAEADEQSDGYAQGETRTAKQPGWMRQPGESHVRTFDPFSPLRSWRGPPCGQTLVYYSGQSLGEHHVTPPHGIRQITLFEALTIGLGERAARRSVEQLIFGFAEPIIFRQVSKILVLERGLFCFGEFSQQIGFDQIFLTVYALHDFLLTQRVTHSSSLSRVRLARLDNALSEMPNLAANILRSPTRARPSSW